MKNFITIFLSCVSFFTLYGQTSTNTNCAKINTLINKAESKMGIKYVWGATGPNNYDCSGFTQAVFREVNIDLPRTAKEQFQCNSGQRVAFINIRKGDLVFFIAEELDRVVGHVGIAITDCSNNTFKFINASSSKGEICIRDLNDKVFEGTYAGARRIIHCVGAQLKEEDNRNAQPDKGEIIKEFPDEFFFHEVKIGETLLSISIKYFVTEQDIMLWNNLKTSSIDGIPHLKIYPSAF
jgi:hypothetical protein